MRILSMDEHNKNNTVEQDKGTDIEAHYRLYFSQFSQAIPAVLALLGINLYNLHTTTPLYLLYPWAGMLMLMYFLRSRLKYAYDKAAAGQTDIVDWGRYIVLGSGLTGLLWGLGAFLTLFGADVEVLMFMIIVVTILVTGNTVTHAAIKNASRAFSTPALLPFVLALLMRGDSLDIEIGIALLLLYITMLLQGKALATIVSRNISLSDDYFMTIRQLETSQRQSSQLIAGLEKQMRETKDVEYKLLNAEERYRFAEQQAGFGHWQWDVDGNRILFSAEASLLLYGDEEEKEQIGDIFSLLSKIVHPDDYGRLYKAINYSLQSHRRLEQKFRRLTQGKDDWLQLKADVVDDNQGGKALRGIVLDINDVMLNRLRMDQNIASIHALSQENSALLDMMNHGVVKINSDGEIERFNKSMCELLRLSEQDALMLVGLDVNKLLTEKSMQLLHNVIDIRQPHRDEIVFQTKGAESGTITIPMSILPLSQNGVYSGLLLVEQQN